MSTRITFLDEDHVMRVTRQLLTARSQADWAEIVDFFAPERVDRARLRELADGLRAADGVEVRQLDDAHDSTMDGSAVLIFRRAGITASTMDRYPKLRLIQRLGERTDGIDLAAARERGIEVSCVPRRSLAATAEHVLLLALAIGKRLIPADRAVRAGRVDPRVAYGVDGSAYNWVGFAGARGVSGRTLGIVGLGEVGSLVAARARAFGMRVLYAGRHQLPAEREAMLGTEYRSLPELLAQSDIVSLHTRGTPDNDGLIGRAEIALMRQGAALINTSRGRLVDEDALFDALVEGRLIGAGLDVHRVEPRPADDRFSTLDNVVLTPHLAAGSRTGLLEEFEQVFDNVRLVIAGGVPRHGRVVAA